MGRTAVTVLGVCGAAALGAAVWRGAGSAEVRAVTTPAPEFRCPHLPPAARPVGMVGCLSAACHGAPAGDSLAGADGPSWRASGTCWAATDPHAGAFDLLTDRPRRPVRTAAAEMVRRLGTGVPAHEDARCLACHTNPALSGPEPALRELRREGVSCEACHGNAGGWVRGHTTWGGDRRGPYATTGMTPLFDVGERSATCAGCHVGAPADPARGYPARDVNHDLLAAGHPRLDFDFAEHHRRLPKHWREKERVPNANNTGPAAEARRWLVGRVAHAEAACRLLADRAARAADERAPWPEFAEFDCAACHHAIPADWRSRPERLGTRAPGSLTWQPVWPVTGGFGRPPELDEVKALAAVMGRPRPAGFDRVGGPAAAAAGRLGGFRRTLASMPDADLLRTARDCFPVGIGDHPDWAPAGQVLWGLAALARDRPPGAPDPGFDRAFGAIRRRDWGDARPALDRLLAAPRPPGGP